MKTKRTRNYNPDGSIVYNTLNSTGLTSNYSNINARFNSKYGVVSSHESNGKTNCNKRTSCTLTGCGKQCCTSTVILSNIASSVWTSHLTYGLIFGTWQ